MLYEVITGLRPYAFVFEPVPIGDGHSEKDILPLSPWDDSASGWPVSEHFHNVCPSERPGFQDFLKGSRR